MPEAVTYELPHNWILYDPHAIAHVFAEAKAVILSLQTIPYQRRWVDALQKMELKREVAGTSRIEGAEFTDRELEAALNETPEQLFTRSQRQVRAAVRTYRWIATIPDDHPINSDLIKDLHRRMIRGADDDHCAPGQIRGVDENVTFGTPRHRGANGGTECNKAFEEFTLAIQREYPKHDPIIQALAAHYHLAALHPFSDGNGRSARGLEVLFLQRAGLRDTTFIAISNYYYDEKASYLKALAAVREKRHDLTPFLIFGLKGIATQSRRLLSEISKEVSKELFRSLAHELFARLESPRKRAIVERQLEILNLVLEAGSVEFDDLIKRTAPMYTALKKKSRATIRDLDHLIQLGALAVEKKGNDQFNFSVRLEWPTEITETEFFKKIKNLPKAKTLSFLR